MLTLLISATIILGGQFTPIELSNLDSEESELFLRYSQLMDQKVVYFLHSTLIEFKFACSLKTRDELLSGYAKGYGIDFSKKDSDNRLIKPFDVYVFGIKESCLVKHFINNLAPGSLIYRAFTYAVDNKKLLNSDQLKSCAYTIRPWITDNLLRTERITITVNISTSVSQKTITFSFEPKSG